MKQWCITILGADQIDNRHLQSLCHLKNPTIFYLVGPSDEFLQIAQGRYKEVSSSNKQGTKL
jgi:hypothetical protein